MSLAEGVGFRSGWHLFVSVSPWRPKFQVRIPTTRRDYIRIKTNDPEVNRGPISTFLVGVGTALVGPSHLSKKSGKDTTPGNTEGSVGHMRSPVRRQDEGSGCSDDSWDEVGAVGDAN